MARTRFSGDANSSKSPWTTWTSDVRFLRYSSWDCGTTRGRGVSLWGGGGLPRASLPPTVCRWCIVCTTYAGPVTFATPRTRTHLAAQVSGAEYRVDLAGLQQLLELRRQVAGAVRDVQIADAQDEHGCCEGAMRRLAAVAAPGREGAAAAIERHAAARGGRRVAAALRLDAGRERGQSPSLPREGSIDTTETRRYFHRVPATSFTPKRTGSRGEARAVQAARRGPAWPAASKQRRKRGPVAECNPSLELEELFRRRRAAMEVTGFKPGSAALPQNKCVGIARFSIQLWQHA
eukprot:363974-Chlamydomonas_euryale.AAC.14